MSAPVKRSILSFSRDLEFATETELAKRMGCSKHYWLRAVIKELIDNSLDACEEAGIEPDVGLSVGSNGVITVADSGPGMSPELVERLCIRAERTSTREAFAACDRGSQGNALPTIMALAFGFDRDEAAIMITSHGVEHAITLRVNRLKGCIDLEHTTCAVAVTHGTVVKLPWPDSISFEDSASLVYHHALLNPHATFRMRFADRGEWNSGPSVPITKWTPGLPTPAHWYTSERFAHRVLLEIRNDTKITVAQFLATFKGLTSSVKRSEVAADAGLSYQPLAALLDGSGTALDLTRTETLLAAMQAAGRPPKHAVLGAVGKDTFARWAANHDCGDPQLLAYTTVDGVVTGDIPYRYEIGFCHLPGGLDGRKLLIGQNFSPAISAAEMVNAILPYASWHFGGGQDIALFLHRITPARQTLDYGKSKLAIDFDETREVKAALEKIAKPWMRYLDAKNRGKRPTLPDEPKPERVTFKAAAFQVMAEAYDVASSGGQFPIISQQVFYQARPKILQLTGKKELRDEERARFCYTLLPLFMQEYAELTRDWRILYKPRGELIEPHTGRRIGLGTTDVALYRAGWTNGLAIGDTDFAMPEWEVATHGPHHRYGGVVVVEKGGIADVLRHSGIGQRRDVAVIGNEGQSVEAELVLADAFGDVEVPIFLLADFDRQGFTIAENLRAGTWRHRYQNHVQVIHVGLRLAQIGGLEDEPIGENTRKHVSDDRLRECGATDDEIAFLQARRVELNALNTKQLVDMVGRSLDDHGIIKIIPAADDLKAAWRAAKAHAEIAEAVKAANKRAERWQAEPAPDALEERVSALLRRQPTMSWDEALWRIVEDLP